jgi:hypothetical protein
MRETQTEICKEGLDLVKVNEHCRLAAAVPTGRTIAATSTGNTSGTIPTSFPATAAAFLGAASYILQILKRQHVKLALLVIGLIRRRHYETAKDR